MGAAGCSPSTQLLSAISGGSSEGNALGGAAVSLSKYGRLAGFSSTATNLVSPNTTSSQYYVRDTCIGAAAGCTPITLLASVTQNGLEPHGGVSEGVLASNSCNVAFTSSATDVVGGVTIPNEVYLSSCTPNNLAAGFLSTRLVSCAATCYQRRRPLRGVCIHVHESSGCARRWAGRTKHICARHVHRRDGLLAFDDDGFGGWRGEPHCGEQPASRYQ